jgi:pyrroloquinoline quinone (PQQ) biosynthesis protein C
VGLKERLLRLYDDLPFHYHPLWKAVLAGDLTFDQVLAAERQHFVRSRAGRSLREIAMREARAGQDERLFEAILETYLDECTDKGGPSHLDLIERLLTMGGLTKAEVHATLPTPANSAAIALYGDISRRGVECHMLGAGFVEHYYSKLSLQIYQSYVDKYGMTDEQAETYRIHGPVDAVHADRAFRILDTAAAHLGESVIELAVRDAFVATSLHYDGMLHAATNQLRYWSGEK